MSGRDVEGDRKIERKGGPGRHRVEWWVVGGWVGEWWVDGWVGQEKQGRSRPSAWGPCKPSRCKQSAGAS